MYHTGFHHPVGNYFPDWFEFLINLSTLFVSLPWIPVYPLHSQAHCFFYHFKT